MDTLTFTQVHPCEDIAYEVFHADEVVKEMHQICKISKSRLSVGELCPQIILSIDVAREDTTQLRALFREVILTLVEHDGTVKI